MRCPSRLLVYVEHSSHFRQSEQLFVCFVGRSKGLPVMKQRLSRWIVDAIVYRPGLCLSVLTVSYSSEGPLHQRNGLLLGLVQQHLIRRSVRQPAGLHGPPSLGFITWTSLLFRHRSCVITLIPYVSGKGLR